MKSLYLLRVGKTAAFSGGWEKICLLVESINGSPGVETIELHVCCMLYAVCCMFYLCTIANCSDGSSQSTHPEALLTQHIVRASSSQIEQSR